MQLKSEAHFEGVILSIIPFAQNGPVAINWDQVAENINNNPSTKFSPQWPRLKEALKQTGFLSHVGKTGNQDLWMINQDKFSEELPKKLRELYYGSKQAVSEELIPVSQASFPIALKEELQQKFNALERLLGLEVNSKYEREIFSLKERISKLEDENKKYRRIIQRELKLEAL